MRGMPYSQASRRTDDRRPTDRDVLDALARQAARRPVKEPPRTLNADQTLPKVGKPGRRRRPR